MFSRTVPLLLLLSAVALLLPSALADLDEPTPGELTLANARKLPERKVKARDYRADHCHDKICREECEKPKGVAGAGACPFNVAGFESYPIQTADDEESEYEAADIIQTIASTIGAPAVAVVTNRNMSTWSLTPSNPQDVAPFWTSVEDWFLNDRNVTNFGATDRSSTGLAFDRFNLDFSQDKKAEPKYMQGVGLQFEKIIEYEDKDGDGVYDPNGNDTAVQVVYLTELNWLKTTSLTGDFSYDMKDGVHTKNETRDERGLVRSHFQFSSAQTNKTKARPLSGNYPAHMFSLDMETSNVPFRPASPAQKLKDEPDNYARIVSPNATRIQVRVQDFPYKGKKSRLALVAVMGTSGTTHSKHPKEDAFVRTTRNGFENVYMAGKASHKYKAYLSWTPNAFFHNDGKVRIERDTWGGAGGTSQRAAVSSSTTARYA